MFTELWTWQQDLQSLYETPALPEDEERIVHRDQAREVIAAARAAGRTILAESESKAILAAYGIPITETRIAVAGGGCGRGRGGASATRSCSSSTPTPSPTRPTWAA